MKGMRQHAKDSTGPFTGMNQEEGEPFLKFCCPICAKDSLSIIVLVKSLNERNKEFLEALEDCWYQFATYTTPDGKQKQSTGGLSTLERLERLLKENGKLRG